MELLKLRFGEAPMHFCEVMLKVGARAPRSRLVPAPAQTLRRPVSPGHGGLAPHQRQHPGGGREAARRGAAALRSLCRHPVSEFWPPFKDEKLEVPEDIREALEVYCRKYEKLKVGLCCCGRGRLGRVLCLLWDPRPLRSPWSPCVRTLHALLCPTVLAPVLTLGRLCNVRPLVLRTQGWWQCLAQDTHCVASVGVSRESPGFSWGVWRLLWVCCEPAPGRAGCGC